MKNENILVDHSVDSFPGSENNFVGISGGKDSTFFEVLSQSPGISVNYPSFKNGLELHYAHPDYFKNKITVESYCLKLVVSGNPVSCESYLKEKGFKAFSSSPNSVSVTF